ncbi:MAG: hypothetical protein IH859_05715 [Chloroflexi bacterium]|nr:hypothetical protein [Chloroflexota bacterium]
MDVDKKSVRPAACGGPMIIDAYPKDCYHPCQYEVTDFFLGSKLKTGIPPLSALV